MINGMMSGVLSFVMAMAFFVAAQPLPQSGAKQITFSINADQTIGDVSPMIYGQMIEQAYWSVHLGLWTQLIDNGGFELDRDQQFRRVAQKWNLMSTNTDNHFSAELDKENPFNAKFSQKINIGRYVSGELRLSQKGLYVKRGVDYEGFIFLRGNLSGKVRVALVSDTGQELDSVDLPETSRQDWTKCEFVLRPKETCKDTMFVLCMSGEGTIGVDQLQIHPSDSYQGHGTRTDLVELYKDLNPAFIRWPGGAYLMWHHWKNGIGPRENRPVTDGRQVYGSEGEWDTNLFGTDEFMQLCKDIGTEPMLNINIKDGLQNALDWIEYCNGSQDTKWGSQRALNGHPEPYQVKLWVIDNEPAATTANKGYTLGEYPQLCRKFSEAMKKRDPSITILNYGHHDYVRYLNRIPTLTKNVINEVSDLTDHIAIHSYYSGPVEGTPYKIAQIIDRTKDHIDQSCKGRDVKVAMPEWNPKCLTEQSGDMGQAIEAAQLFHVMERASADNMLDIAAPCQLCINTGRYDGFWLRSGLVQINSHSAWTSPMYHVNALYSRLRQPNMVQVTATDLPMRRSKLHDVKYPVVDVVATRDEATNRMVIKAVNNSHEAYPLRFDLAAVKSIKAIRLTQIRSDSLSTMNTEASPQEVVTEVATLSPEGSSFQYMLEPYTIAAMELELE